MEGRYWGGVEISVLALIPDERLSYEVEVAAASNDIDAYLVRTPREAVAMLRTREFSLLLLPVESPWLDGGLLLRELAAAGNSQPTVVYSSRRLGKEEVYAVMNWGAMAVSQEVRLAEALAGLAAMAVMRTRNRAMMDELEDSGGE